MRYLLLGAAAYLYGCAVGLRQGREAGKRLGHKEAADWLVI